MEAIYIPRIAKAPNRTEEIHIQEFIAGLETLMPVRASLKVVHQGNYLEVAAQGEAIVTLTCHRCLKQYNHRLTIDTSEMIWLSETGEQPSMEAIAEEIAVDDLIETLPIRGYFQPDVWVYEQMCLALPVRQLCDNKCPGIPLSDRSANDLSDRRWSALEALKQQLPSIDLN
jgi:uncharacterized protein